MATKQFHGVDFNGLTFGMEIDTGTEAWKRFKKAVKFERCIGIFGDDVEQDTCPANAVATIMREAGWLAREGHLNKFHIDGFNKGEDIYIKFLDDPIDFRTRG